MITPRAALEWIAETGSANRRICSRVRARPRRLVDVSKVDMSAEILGVKYDTPIVVAPIGGQKAFHEDGEIATAKAAKVGNHLQNSLHWHDQLAPRSLPALSTTRPGTRRSARR